MKAKFISHPDFSNLEPLCVYHKERGSDGKLIFDRHNEEEYILKNHPKELYNKHIIFRKKASFDSFKRATLKITADDYYKLYINGKFVTEGPSPGYHNNYYYNEIDVTDFLTEGENTFAVHTYYQGFINRVWVS
ncbi:MAG: alpha-L-rhamnosidase N-terminal domain-containing protein [Clostridia bacterium]|nr:alpha-L-rhamnosidase N-terminal domain-containing protein [Clostridia bacterium]